MSDTNLNDDSEAILSEILSSEEATNYRSSSSIKSPGPTAVLPEGEKSNKNTLEAHSQWAIGPNNRFMPVGSTKNTLEAGVYEPFAEPGLWGVEKVAVGSDGIYLLPDMPTQIVLDEAKKFWGSESKYIKHSLLFKRGILLFGPPGCHAKGTEILMFNGSTKKVEDVRVGDLLMGDDSTPRKVLSLHRGNEQMYRVTPVKGDSYVVNESHILSLKRSGSSESIGKNTPKILDISVRDFLSKSKTIQNKYKGYRTKVTFSAQPVPLEPYFLGVWLGDGTSSKATITSMDKEIVDSVYDAATSFGLSVRVENNTGGGRAKNYHITATNASGNGRDGKNGVLTTLSKLGVINNKHIPSLYLHNSEDVRLNILAGLIDTDGHLGNNYMEITSKSPQLASDIVFLARSLGFAAYARTSFKTCQTGKGGMYTRISISGQLDNIPTRLQRKKATPRLQVKSVLSTGITITPVGPGDYFGFELDGNHRYLMGDFTVTHNSGKSIAVKLLIKELVDNDGIVLLVSNTNLAMVVLKAIRRIEPKRNLIVVLEDIDEILQYNGESNLLDLLDGEKSISNILFVATTNYPERLGPRIINRPSRFDRRLHVGMPSPAARKSYLEQATHGGLTTSQLEKWTIDTKELSIAHMRELVASVYCLDQSYDDVIERLHEMAKSIKEQEGFKRNAMGFGRKAMEDLSTPDLG